MKPKKIPVILLAFLLALSLWVPAFAADAAVVTRGEFLTALCSLNDETDADAGQEAFDDVPAEGELAQTIRWALGTGIVNGYGNGRFGPEDPVSREQMAAMLYRCAQSLGKGFEGAWMFLLDYPDAGEISEYADEAMHWAVMNGILTGTGNGLEPKAAVTQAQLALVLERWQKAVGNAQEPQTADESTALTDVPVLHEEEFGGVYICCTIEDFNALGFAYGDSVTVTFSNGYVLEDLPYYNGYYTRTGEPLLVAYPGYPYIKAAINSGDDLYSVAGLQEGDTASIVLQAPGKYAALQDARDIHYTDERDDYESDAVFANFRGIRAGEIRAGVLYRSASPCDNQHNRAPYVDALMSEAEVGFILDLSDTDEKIQGYLDASDFSSPGFRALYEAGKVEPIGLNMNYSSQEFREKLVNGLIAMSEADGPYLIHCTEGKDRTGFVCMLLEALCGASCEEIEQDYMITYANYYGITEEAEKDRYDVIVENVLVPMIESLSGDQNLELWEMDLSGCAAHYLLDGGMTDEQIMQLMACLPEITE